MIDGIVADLALTSDERAMLGGEGGAGTQMAMEVLVAYASAIGAKSLIPIAGAHVDGCLYHGEAGLDFVDALVARGGRVRVPTTLNVGSIDLIHPERVKLQGEAREKPWRLMKAHEALGCVASFTCAPYQTLFRPRFGDHVAWGESNAIVFANSVIGARTNRYGDFIDLCCAMAGRAPAWGLHLDENRRGELLVMLSGFGDAIAPTDSLYVAVGLITGKAAGERVPVIEGLPPPENEDQLKALGAAAASVGSVGLFHVVGVTPEAPTTSAAFGGTTPAETLVITPADVSAALSRLSTVPDGAPLSALCLGTPHFSMAEWDRLELLLLAASPSGRTPIYVNTGRATLDRLREGGRLDRLTAMGVIPVVDTCTYVTAILEKLDHAVMTNSGKWAHYAPSNIGCTVAFGSLEECVASAVTGRVTRA